MRRLSPILGLALLLPATGAAQQSADGPYVLHEYVTRIEAPTANGSDSDGPVQPQAPPGQPPALSLETRDGEPIYSKSGPVFDEPIPAPHGALSPYASANTLDDRTDRVDSLTYFATFEPSVIPYKRAVVQNHAVRRASGEYALEVRPGERESIGLGSVPEDVSSSTFWGTFLLRLEPNRLHPIASVAPDQQILQIVAEPDVALDVQRDAAGNFFVLSKRGGLVRMNMQVAVREFYFGGDLPEVGWDDFESDRVPPMNPSVKRHALDIARSVGFGRNAPPRETVLEMVRYFRNFEAKEFPEESAGDDRLAAIVENAIGVCRHRSLAFVFLAQALGIPTRYVYNEAHAFVEVHWPGYGWRRLDLGGAADELNASANDGRAVHDPGDDGLPKPERFLDEQRRMARTGWDAPPSAEVGGGNGEREGGTDGGTNGSIDNPGGDRDGSANGDSVADGQTNGAGTDVSVSEQDEPLFEEPPADDRTETRLVIEEATATVRRGGDIRLVARLTDASGRALADRDVDVYLGPVGSANPLGALRLGTVRTDRRGRVSSRVKIPKEHAIGRWSLFLHFGGDESHQAATAE